MSEKNIPSKINSFLNLIRFNKPIGFLLLMWPCWFALAILLDNLSKHIKWFVFFALGAFLMRSAGCIINDLIDINIDKNVKRTASRPLASGKISIIEAIILLVILLFISLIILMQFNYLSILLGLLSIPLIILYPYMKRITYWPQLLLGITFNWGVLIVSVQFYNQLSITSIILYVGCIFWTLGYDTIYAYQDREEDIKNNIKSTAVLFNNNGKIIVKVFYLVFLSIIGFLVYEKSGSFLSILVLILFLIAMLFFLNKWNIKSKKSSNFYFNCNNLIGILCFVYLVIF